MKCPECGGRIELTIEVYAHLEDGIMVVDDVSAEDARWYCENDHELPEDLRDKAEMCIKHLSAFGREPGSGSLGIMFPLASPTAN